jgi:hypothetical protein
MPIFVFECNEHGVYEALVGMTTDSSALCPFCGVAGSRGFAPTVGLQMGETCIDADRLPAGERDFILGNKKFIEEHAAEIRSGAMRVSEKGPGWSRPRVEKRFW